MTDCYCSSNWLLLLYLLVIAVLVAGCCYSVCCCSVYWLFLFYLLTVAVISADCCCSIWRLLLCFCWLLQFWLLTVAVLSDDCFSFISCVVFICWLLWEVLFADFLFIRPLLFLFNLQLSLLNALLLSQRSLSAALYFSFILFQLHSFVTIVFFCFSYSFSFQVFGVCFKSIFFSY